MTDISGGTSAEIIRNIADKSTMTFTERGSEASKDTHDPLWEVTTCHGIADIFRLKVME